MVVERPSVQAVIYDVETGKMLLIMIHDTSMDELVWRLVKGGVAEGEADPEAMRREIAEEVGLRDVRVLEKINYYEFQYMDLRHLVSVYLVEAEDSLEIPGIHGGLYAALRFKGLENITEAWGRIHSWVEESEDEKVDWRRGEHGWVNGY